MEHIASKHKDFQLSKCSVCDTKFLTEKSLNYHMIEKHGESTETHICPFCGKHYAIKQKLSNHIATVHEGKYKKTRYNCTMCDASYSYIKGLNQHVATVHEEKTYECKYCKEVFITGKSLSDALLFAKHGENMLCTKIVLNVRNNLFTQHVLPRFELGIFMY